MRLLALVLVGLALAIVPALGCGGGGGAAPPATDAFLGTYYWHQQMGVRGPPLAGVAVWGTMHADGLGSIDSGSSTAISNGLVDGGLLMPTPYRIAAGRRLLWIGGGIPRVEGGISANGRLAIGGAVNVGGAPFITLHARREGGLSNASLTGTYHIAQFATSVTGASDLAIWGAATFNGTGGAAFTLWVNLDGLVSGPSSGPGSYTLAADGTLTLEIGGARYQGGVVRGGELAFFGGSTIPGHAAATGILLKYATGGSDATFNGDYHAVALTAAEALTPTINWHSLTGVLHADGLGNWIWTTLTMMDDGGAVTQIPGPHMNIPYTVAANGGMNVGTSTLGAISSDGSVGAFVGSTSAGVGPTLWILIR